MLRPEVCIVLAPLWTVSKIAVWVEHGSALEDVYQISMRHLSSAKLGYNIQEVESHILFFCKLIVPTYCKEYLTALLKLY